MKCGIVRATPLDEISRERFLRWLEQHFQGEMHYMARAPNRRINPQEVLLGAKSLISILINYFSPEPQTQSPMEGVISRYAWGRDYHLVVQEKLRVFDNFLSEILNPYSSIFYVDTGPVLDKWWAQEAGLGWIGKNANLITPEIGSWVFVGEILTTAEFEPDDYDLPFRHPRVKVSENASTSAPTFCGSCTQCMKACPTQAIVSPFVVDARRCISYLTIELRGSIPRDLRSLIGNRIFGCDDCQEVCPWNRFAVRTSEADFHPSSGNLQPRLTDLLHMSREEFNHRFKESPIRRAGYAGFLRNVAVALGNSHSPEAEPALVEALSHPEPLVRQHVVWALGEIRTKSALTAVQHRINSEDHPAVREEILTVLKTGS